MNVYDEGNQKSLQKLSYSWRYFYFVFQPLINQNAIVNFVYCVKIVIHTIISNEKYDSLLITCSIVKAAT